MNPTEILYRIGNYLLNKSTNRNAWIDYIHRLWQSINNQIKIIQEIKINYNHLIKLDLLKKLIFWITIQFKVKIDKIIIINHIIVINKGHMEVNHRNQKDLTNKQS